jgi:hypothetical protein
MVVTISYKLSDHTVTTSAARAGATPDLSKQRAIWVSSDLVAWPSSMVPTGVDPALLRWGLAWSKDGGLAVDAEAITGGTSAPLTFDSAGLPASVVAAHPELKGYLALRLDKKTA